MAVAGQFDNIVFDCDGVLWNGNDPMPGAAETLKSLQAHGKNLYFVTNASTTPRPGIAAKLQELLGYKADPETQVAHVALGLPPLVAWQLNPCLMW